VVNIYLFICHDSTAPSHPLTDPHLFVFSEQVYEVGQFVMVSLPVGKRRKDFIAEVN